MRGERQFNFQRKFNQVTALGGKGEVFAAFINEAQMAFFFCGFVT